DRVHREHRVVIPGRNNLLRCVTADDRRAAFVDPWQRCHVPSALTYRQHVLGSELTAATSVPGPEEYGITLPHLDTLSSEGSVEVFRKDALTGIQPRLSNQAGDVEDDAASGDS